MIRPMMFASGTAFALNVTASVASPNLHQMALDAGWNGYSKLIVSITAPLINTLWLRAAWTFPQGIEITVSANTRVGGVAGGGSALIAELPVAVRNLGVISGGGGNGGGGGRVDVTYQGSTIYGYAGYGGSGAGFASNASLSVVAASPGTPGTYEQYTGTMRPDQEYLRPWVQGGQGGSGGDWGQDGVFGQEATNGGFAPIRTAYPAQAGGAAGKSVSGNAYITWLATGTRLGAIT